MLEKIKKLLQIYREERYKENTKTLVNDKTGLSSQEIEKITNTPPFSEGVANLFNYQFYYSHGESFLHSMEEIFNEQVYKFNSDTDEPYIIDCGANIGLSIYYFKKIFPQSKILAFEPDDKIFQLLKKNIDQINTDGSIILKNEAVWKEDTELSFFSEGALAGSSVIDFGKKNNVIKVKAIDLKKHLFQSVDFLKIDIEGAENELIFDIAPQLRNVKNLFLEYHGLVNQPQNLGDILNLLKECGFEYYIRLAADTLQFPFCSERTSSFNQQLNIFCYRK
jgi:FkbM family methyltransferase